MPDAGENQAQNFEDYFLNKISSRMERIIQNILILFLE
jgi:hypothetical protein